MINTNMFRTADGKNYFVTFCLISSLFFLWALCNGMIDVMDKHFQDYLHLSKSQSAWVQFAHYLGYFLMALPAGWLARKLGYKGGIIAGLLIVALGCFWFIPATTISTFWAFLLGICVISMGLTFLETIANPYTTVLGDPKFGAARINFAQTCNGLGWIAGPPIGGLFFYASESAGGAAAAHKTLWIPYVVIGVIVLLLCVVFYKADIPDLAGEDTHKDAPTGSSIQASSSLSLLYKMMLANVFVVSLAFGMIVVAIASVFSPSDTVTYSIFGACVAIPLIFGAVRLNSVVSNLSSSSIWSYPHFSGATIAQFFYVAAQAGIFAFFMNYMTSEIPPVSEFFRGAWIIGGEHGCELKNGSWVIVEKGAATLMSVGFGFFVLGRFIGANILKSKPAHKVLALYSVINSGLMLLIVLKLGWISFAAVFLSFFFMSVMFPTIFALGIFGLGEKAKIASSFIVMAIMGGAIIPKVMGWIGDHYNMSLGFVIPMICFLVVALYGFSWSKLSGSEGLVGLKSSGGH